jgi:SAM-dependent methyltransferase
MTRARSLPRRSALDLAEGFYLAHTLLAFERHGILDSLARPFTATGLARRHRVRADLLRATLELLAARTNLVACHAGKFRLASEFDDDARFIIHQYLGTYGPVATVLDRVLQNPKLAAAKIDRKQHAKAFENGPTLSCDLITDLIAQLGFNNVLDLGCGNGALLAELTERVKGFSGFGLDSNPAMCTVARRRFSDMPRTSRVKIFRGDSRRPEAAIPGPVVRQVRTLAAASLVNEFFGSGNDEAERWLAHLKAVFPGRTLLIGDYYGQLGYGRPVRSRMLAMHDLVQAISGQGVPPPDLASWKTIYRNARCSLVHVVEDRDSTFFVHLLRL